MAGAASLLIASEARRRSKVYALLFVVFLAATSGLSILLGAVAGIERSIGTELRTTLSADHRLAQGNASSLGDGQLFPGGHAVAGRIAAAAPDANASPRLEFDGILLHTERYEDFRTALVVGIDSTSDAEASGIEGLLTQGRMPGAASVWVNGTPYTPIVVGAALADAMQLRIYEGGENVTASLLNVTAGRFASDSSDARPVVKPCLVVGTFRSGFTPLDTLVVYIDLEPARELLRVQFQDDITNVIVVRGGSDADVGRGAAAEHLLHVPGRAFREDYLASVFRPLATFTRLVTGVVLVLAGGWVAHVVVDAIVTDRRRLSVLRALGLPARLLAGPVGAILFAVAIAGIAGGLALGWIVAQLLSTLGIRAPGYESLDLVATIPPATAAMLSILVLLVALVGAIAAALALRRIPPAEALRS